MEKTFVFKATVLKFVEKPWGWKFVIYCAKFLHNIFKITPAKPKKHNLTRTLGVNTTITKSSKK